MAAMAASLMCLGVEKWGSPAPKSTRFAPWARSLAASAATAMVAETSIRPIRSAKTCEGVETVIALLSLQISLLVQNASQEKPTATQFSMVEKPVQVGQDLAVEEQERIISCHLERSRGP